MIFIFRIGNPDAYFCVFIISHFLSACYDIHHFVASSIFLNRFDMLFVLYSHRVDSEDIKDSMLAYNYGCIHIVLSRKSYQRHYELA